MSCSYEEISKLEEKIAKAEQKIEQLNQQANRASSNAPGSYVTGSSGRTRAQNRATDRALELTIRNATKAVVLYRKVKQWKQQIETLRWRANGGDEILAKQERKRVAAKKKRIAFEKAERKKLLAKRMSGEADTSDWLFIGCYSCGYVLADKWVEVSGDYRRLAFIPYNTLELQVDDSCPLYLVPLIAELHIKIVQCHKNKEKKWLLQARFGVNWASCSSWVDEAWRGKLSHTGIRRQFKQFYIENGYLDKNFDDSNLCAKCQGCQDIPQEKLDKFPYNSYI